MAFAYVNIFLNQGSDFSSVLKLSDIKSDPVDLINYYLVGQVRKHPAAKRYYDLDIKVHDAERGEFIIELSSVITETMKPGRYVYDVIAVSFNDINKRYKIIEGILQCDAQVTKL